MTSVTGLIPRALSGVILILTRNIIPTRNSNVSSLLCCSVSVPLFSPSLRLPPGLPSPDLSAAWAFPLGPVSDASVCLRYCSFHVIFPFKAYLGVPALGF